MLAILLLLQGLDDNLCKFMYLSLITKIRIWYDIKLIKMSNYK